MVAGGPPGGPGAVGEEADDNDICRCRYLLEDVVVVLLSVVSLRVKILVLLVSAAAVLAFPS